MSPTPRTLPPEHGDKPVPLEDRTPVGVAPPNAAKPQPAPFGKTSAPAVIPPEHATKHSVMDRIEEVAERFLGARAAQIKALVAELRELL